MLLGIKYIAAEKKIEIDSTLTISHVIDGVDVDVPQVGIEVDAIPLSLNYVLAKDPELHERFLQDVQKLYALAKEQEESLTEDPVALKKKARKLMQDREDLSKRHAELDAHENLHRARMDEERKDHDKKIEEKLASLKKIDAVIAERTDVASKTEEKKEK